MNVCSNFALSLTGGFQECRNCGREKKFHNLDFENKNIEYVQKSTNNSNAAKFQSDKLQQIAIQKQVEEDELKAKACNNFVLALVGQFQQCGNCKIEKKYHKLDTAGQIAYQPKSQLNRSSIQPQQQAKPSAIAEIVSETMMVQSVKDRIAQMNQKKQGNNEPQFRPSVKKEQVKEKVLGQAEIVTEQLFTSVSDKKGIFDKQRIRKTIEQSSQQIREEQNVEGIRKAESSYITSQDNQQQIYDEQQQFTNNQYQENQQQDSKLNQYQQQQSENDQDQQQQYQDQQQQYQDQDQDQDQQQQYQDQQQQQQQYQDQDQQQQYQEQEQQQQYQDQDQQQQYQEQEQQQQYQDQDQQQQYQEQDQQQYQEQEQQQQQQYQEQEQQQQYQKEEQEEQQVLEQEQEQSNYQQQQNNQYEHDQQQQDDQYDNGQQDIQQPDQENNQDIY
ncbi:unnamed protein product [Paramecium sonneborni]|uniref:Uncharacterized protein n=1 Tax=Paramecium sonneborni TaxID=65129 RepID=A0A8S1Q2W8_9CILI|nr:unnamed protein product [Paramecium sonneborni]